MVYPLDRTAEYQSDFEKAEKAWLRWKRSPLRDDAYEQKGEVLMQEFIDAARAYLNYARHHTEGRRRQPLQYTLNAKLKAGTASNEDSLDIPDFLRRDRN